MNEKEGRSKAKYGKTERVRKMIYKKKKGRMSVE